ncbi:MAG TPA: NUDIX domain-containing protein [Rhizomicrobium sp.]|jgi:predicted NUDIX family NTP pyrophosphohydrolase|nr:NUDIX domain-containing protein [Rhizomicrobium sp.]
MAQRSAGLLLFRRQGAAPGFFLVHPGGPFWAKKDEGAWSIPKGLYAESEEPLDAARREFREETGFGVEGEFVGLGEFRQPGGKVISAWMIEADCDAAMVKSNIFTLEWPPRSGKTAEFPEVDRAGWFDSPEAFVKILHGQKPILERALELLAQ